MKLKYKRLYSLVAVIIMAFILAVPCYGYPMVDGLVPVADLTRSSSSPVNYYAFLWYNAGNLNDFGDFPVAVNGTRNPATIYSYDVKITIFLIETGDDGVAISTKVYENTFMFGELIEFPAELDATAYYNLQIAAESTTQAVLCVPGLVEYQPETYFYAIKEWVTDVLVDDFLDYSDLLVGDQQAVSIVALIICALVFFVPILMIVILFKIFWR